MADVNHTTDVKFEDPANAGFGDLIKNVLFGFCLNIKEHVLTTHRELAILRRCSEVLRAEPKRKLLILSPAHQVKTNFIVKTLLHLGVSCGQIEVNHTGSSAAVPDGIWLLVAGTVSR